MERWSRGLVLLIAITVFAIGCGEADDPEPTPTPSPDVEDDDPEEVDDEEDVEPLPLDEIPPISVVSDGPPPPSADRPIDDEPQVVPDDDPVLDQDCPRSVHEWRGDEDPLTLRPRPTRPVEWPLSPSTQLCNMSWQEIITTPPRGDAWVILAREYIATRLNIADGVSPPLSANQDIIDAEAILRRCEPLTPPETSDRRRALQLANSLATFNEAICPPAP